jgi:hypothetical protein
VVGAGHRGDQLTEERLSLKRTSWYCNGEEQGLAGRNAGGGAGEKDLRVDVLVVRVAARNDV